MKSIQRRFENFKAKNLELGDYVVLARAVKGQKFSYKIISRWFGKLVEKTDYGSGSRTALINHLFKISNNS